MPAVGIEPTISPDERPQTYALDRVATGTGSNSSSSNNNNNNNNITARMLGVFINAGNKPLYIIHITFEFCRG